MVVVWRAARMGAEATRGRGLTGPRSMNPGRRIGARDRGGLLAWVSVVVVDDHEVAQSEVGFLQSREYWDALQVMTAATESRCAPPMRILSSAQQNSIPAGGGAYTQSRIRRTIRV